jgi:hypothetical protein
MVLLIKTKCLDAQNLKNQLLAVSTLWDHKYMNVLMNLIEKPALGTTTLHKEPQFTAQNTCIVDGLNLDFLHGRQPLRAQINQVCPNIFRNPNYFLSGRYKSGYQGSGNKRFHSTLNVLLHRQVTFWASVIIPFSSRFSIISITNLLFFSNWSI